VGLFRRRRRRRLLLSLSFFRLSRLGLRPACFVHVSALRAWAGGVGRKKSVCVCVCVYVGMCVCVRARKCLAIWVLGWRAPASMASFNLLLSLSIAFDWFQHVLLPSLFLSSLHPSPFLQQSKLFQLAARHDQVLRQRVLQPPSLFLDVTTTPAGITSVASKGRREGGREG